MYLIFIFVSNLMKLKLKKYLKQEKDNLYYLILYNFKRYFEKWLSEPVTANSASTKYTQAEVLYTLLEMDPPNFTSTRNP